MTGTLRLRVVVLLYCTGLLSAAVLSIFAGMIPTSPEAAVFLNYAATQLGFLVPIALYRWRSRAKLSAFLPLKSPKLKALPLVIPVAIGAYMQNLMLQTGISELWAMAGVYSTVTIPDLTNAGYAIAAVLVIAALPAVAEEFLFRGIFRNSCYKSAYFMLIYSSAVFAVGHLSPVQAVHQFILGLILTYIVYTTGTVWYSVGIHFLNNIFALFLPLIPGYAEILNFGGIGAFVMPIMTVAGALILYPSVYALTGLHSGAFSKKDGFLHVLFRKGDERWYASERSDEAVGAAGVAGALSEDGRDKVYAIALLAILVLASVLNVVIESML